MDIRHFLLLLAVPVGVLFGEPSPPATRRNLEECISMALKQNRLLLAARHGVEVAEARLAEARSGRNPRIQVTDLAGAVSEARGNAVSSEDKITDTDGLGPFTRLDVNLIQPIYTFGRIQAYVDAALHGLEAEKASRARTEADTVREVKRLYYALLLNRELVSLLQDSKKNFQEAHDRFQEIIDEGTQDASLVDFVKLKVALAEISSNLFKVQKAEELTLAGLRQTVGLADRSSDFDIRDTALSPAAVNLQTLDQYLSEVFRNRAEWNQIEEGVRAKEALLQAEKRKLFPTVFMTVPFRYAVAPNRDDQKNPFVRDDFNYVEGGPALGITWEFSWGGNQARIRQARAELRKLLAQRDAATLGFPVEVRKSFLQVLEMQERMDQMLGAYKAARGLVTSMAGAKGLGVQDLRELFEAYGLYTKATSDHRLAVYQYNLSLADLTQAVGREVASLEE